MKTEAEMRRFVAADRLRTAKASVEQAILRIKEAGELLEANASEDRYFVYDTNDAQYHLRRLASDLGETIANVERGPSDRDDSEDD